MPEESTTPDLVELAVPAKYRSAAPVSIWTDGLAERVMNYADIDDGRAAAERLAESRG
jgi:hypothetical protein